MLGPEKAGRPTRPTIAMFRNSLVTEQTPGSQGNRCEIHRRPPPRPSYKAGLWNRVRAGHWRDTADIRCARELRKAPSRNEGLVTLGPWITAGLALAASKRSGKGIDVLVGTLVRVGRIETVRQR